MDEYPDFIFTRGEFWVYQWIEKFHPELFERIKELVKQRRWIVVNGWYVQPDMNAPSGESFVRQGLYGKRYFMEKFGIEPTIGYCVDSFGHAATLPQIFKKCGYEAYVFTRPSPHELKLPQVFRWRWKDGSEIIGYRVSGHYETRDMVDLSPYIDQNLAAAPEDIPYVMAFYGVGDHGGGPTRYQLNWILDNIHYRDDAELIFGDPLTYFEKIKPYLDLLPTYEGEIHHHAIGCYSANAKIKWLNRQAENWIPISEILSVVASRLVGAVYPYDLFEDMWKRLNFNQFHDILSGTTIKEGAVDAARELERVVHTAEENAYLKLHAIVAEIDTRGDGIPFIAFNPSPFHREEYVEFAPWTEWKVLKSGYVVDSEGDMTPFVNIQPHPLVWGQNRIVFKVSLPPFGYKVYWLKEQELTDPIVRQIKATERPISIENKFYRIKVTPDFRVEIFDKIGGRKLFDDFQVPVVVDDPYDTWGHKTWSFDQDGDLMMPVEAELVENTDFKATIRLKYRYNSSTLTQRLTLYGDEKRIVTDFQVVWNDENKQLRIVNRFRDRIKKLVVEAPYGFVERKPDGREQPMQRLLMAELDGYGVAIANDGKYAYDSYDDTVRINVLRCVLYAWHLPFEKEEARDYDFIDRGLHEFTLWTWIYEPGKDMAENFRLAHRLNRPILLMSVPKHKGKLPPSLGFMDIETSSNVLAEILKLKEGEPDKIVLRAWETSGSEGVIRLEVGKSIMSFNVSPYELKTILIDEESAVEADLCERPID